MTTESAFMKVSNQILEATEQVANRFEEGLNILMTGKLPQEQDDNIHQANAGEATTTIDNDELLNILNNDEGDEFNNQFEKSPLEGIAQGVLDDIMAGQSSIGPQGIWEHLQAFTSAIRWTEPFILGLLCFQLFMVCLCIWASKSKRSTTARITVMISIGIVVRCAERINGYAARHWQLFATQNYFDARGIFMGIFFCAPLLLDCFFMLTMFLREASLLVVEVKTLELKKKREAEKKKKEQEKKKDNNNSNNKKRKGKTSKKHD